MAREVLSNGVINPDKYQADWYADLSNNWHLLNNLIGSAISSSEVDSKIATAVQELMVRTFQIVAELPETGTEGVMYLVSIPNTSKYTAYVWENNAYRELGVIQMTITIDDELSTTSENPVQNKVITNALNGKANTSHTHSASDITSGLATVATSGSYNDLSNKPTIPTVNNATLTIQQNGTNVQTFTANASANATANIQCVDLSNNQTIAGNKDFTGTTTAHDLVPSATNTYNFGSSTAQWNNAYIKSLTINGTQFLPSNYMTLNTIQTVTSAKYYTGYQDINSYRLRIKHSEQEKGVIPASNLWNGFVFCDKNNETMFAIEQGMMTNGVIQLTFNGRANDNDTTYTTFLRYINNSDLTTNVVNIIDLMPFGNGTRKLGDTNAKWKSFNGINPGALSLPSVSSGINLDLTNFKTDGSDNKFRLTNFSNYPYDNGWLFIRLNGCTSYYLDHWYKVVSNEYANPSTAIFFMPINDIDHDILLRCVCTSINYIRVFPCQGNV